MIDLSTKMDMRCKEITADFMLSQEDIETLKDGQSKYFINGGYYKLATENIIYDPLEKIQMIRLTFKGCCSFE